MKLGNSDKHIFAPRALQQPQVAGVALDLFDLLEPPAYLAEVEGKGRTAIGAAEETQAAATTETAGTIHRGVI